MGGPEAKVIIIALAATVADVGAETFADTIGNAVDKTEVHTLAVTLPEVVAETVAIY